jgi:hypothetical protein
MDKVELIRIATKIKRETRNPDIIALCDAVLVPAQAPEARYVSKWRQANAERYRRYMRDYMHRKRHPQAQAVALSS